MVVTAYPHAEALAYIYEQVRKQVARSLRALRVSGMTATLETRALQVAQSQMDFIEAFSALVQDELDRRRSRLIDRRLAVQSENPQTLGPRTRRAQV